MGVAVGTGTDVAVGEAVAAGGSGVAVAVSTSIGGSQAAARALRKNRDMSIRTALGLRVIRCMIASQKYLMPQW